MAEQIAGYYTLKVEGGESIELKEGDIDAVVFKVDSPDDADAKSNKMGIILEISGKILQNKNETETKKLATWALVPSGAKDVERQVTVELVKANKVIRQYVLSHAFVVDYTESINEDGAGSFNLFVKQNKTTTGSKVTVEGGYDR
ncbi:MAG: membrane-associated protease 1 [Bacillota bacterium]